MINTPTLSGKPGQLQAVDVGLWIVDRSGGGRRHLVPGHLGKFAWSPDGKQIASTTADRSPDGTISSKVWIVDVDSGRQRTVTTLDHPIETEGVMDWSPDGGSLLLYTSTADQLPNRMLPKLEQVSVIDGRRAPLLSPTTDESLGRAVYAADGKTVIAQRSRRPADPPSPPGAPAVTIPAVGAPDRPTADLVSVRTDGTDVHSLCPIDPDHTLLNWH